MREKYFYRSGIVFLFVFGFNTTFFSQSKTKYDASEGFVAHEWGTFTTLSRSNGELLSGLELEEESLPKFVANLSFTYLQPSSFLPKGFDSKNISIKNVNVKMETPVLYFYSTEASAKSITVDVKFNYGSISQWYPFRSQGEAAPQQTFYDVPQTPVVLDFSNQRIGYISWNALVLPKNDMSKYTNNPAEETAQWLAQRQTASNLIKTEKAYLTYNYQTSGWDTYEQVEKFLFYRGIGNFKQPIKVEFNTSHNLVITNAGKDLLQYVMVYEKAPNGKATIWWAGKIAGQHQKVIIRPEEGKSVSSINEMENFTKQLVASGLYEDEARAMLETWKRSYFEYEGLKVFWILPSAFTEQTLPMQISPSPKSTKRVIVGRSEILTPEFEESLSHCNINEKYIYDRFRLAYQQAANRPTQWTDYNVIEKEPEMTSVTEETTIPFEVFPNPTRENLTVHIKRDGIIKIFGANGQLVSVEENAKVGDNVINMTSIDKGIYLIKVDYGDGSIASKKMIKE